MSGGNRKIGRVAVLVLFTAASFAAAGPRQRERDERAAEEAALRQVLDGFDKVQANIRTLSGEFAETTVNDLLKEPLLAKGRFYLTKPDSMLWEYTEPEVMRFVVAQGEYVGYFPERRRAEKRDVHRWSERILRFFGVGQGSGELEKFYEIRRADPGPEDKDTYLLVLDPKKRRVRKYVEQVRFWVSATTYLPVRIEYRGKDGQNRVIRFQNVRVNPDLAASLYHVEIPPGVTVTEGLSGLGAVRPQP